MTQKPAEAEPHHRRAIQISRELALDPRVEAASSALSELVLFLSGESDAGRRSSVVTDLGGDQIIRGSEDAEVVEALDGDEVDQAVRRGADHRL